MPESETPSRRATRLLLLVPVIVAVVVGAAWITRDRWERSGPPLAFSGWAPYWQTLEAYDSFDANAELFGDVSIVAYHATGAGEIAPYERLSVDAIGRFAGRAQPAEVPLLATIFDETAAGVMAGVLADPATRTAHARAIAEIVFVNGFDGVDLDYEQFAFSDGRDTWDATRPNWITFLRELGDLLHARDKLLVVSVPNVEYTVYDHAAMGAIVDRVRLMAYDFSTSEPGPIAPAEWVREIVDALKQAVPAEKIDLGIPVYGYDWPTSTSGTCQEEPGRRAVMPSSAAERATQHGATVMWDAEAEEARFDYTETFTATDAAGAATTCTVSRTVRYLDDRALHRRAWIANRADLHGVAVWALGNDEPSVWTALRIARDGEDEWPGTTNPTAPTTTTIEPPPTS